MTEWKPIEDYAVESIIGQPVLLYDPTHELYVGEWRWTNWVSVPGTYVRRPTHFMSLPDPPVFA